MRICFFIVSVMLLTGCANSSERPYRLPYADGVEVRIAADNTDHTTPVADMFDMRATVRHQPLVAAAPGWVRFIKDSGNSSASTNNYVWIEHPLDYCQSTGSGAGGVGAPLPEQGPCRSCPDGPGRCNEWSLYAHMRQDSVRGDAGLTEDQWVTEGQFIGIEDDVGFTPCSSGNQDPDCGDHLHFTLWVFEEDSLLAIPSENGDYEDYVDIHGRPERVPLFCTADGLRLVETGEIYEAGPCPPL